MKRTLVRTKNTGEPRYPADEHQSYHDTYSRMVRKSVYLSASSRATDLHNSNALYGIGECQGSLTEITGNGQGYYLKQGNWYQALIPSALKELKKVHLVFKRWQNDQVQGGFALTSPKEWPRDLLEKRLKAEAVLDIRYAEKKAVEDRLNKLIEERNKKPKRTILPLGPQCRMAQASKSAPITEVDGQQVSYNEEGVPFVDEPTSPYHGMSLFHYRQMSKAWRREMGLMPDQLLETAQQIFLQQKEQAKAEGTDPPLFPPVANEFKMAEWMERLGVTKDKFPEWSEGVEPLVKAKSTADKELSS